MCNFGFDLIFFFNDTATTEIYTLSLHYALPIYEYDHDSEHDGNSFYVIHVYENMETHTATIGWYGVDKKSGKDRKSTRLNSSHANISYAVFCLKKKTEVYGNHIYINAYLILLMS